MENKSNGSQLSQDQDQYIVEDFCVGVRFQFSFDDLLKSVEELRSPDIEVKILLGKEFTYEDDPKETDLKISIYKE